MAETLEKEKGVIVGVKLEAETLFQSPYYPASFLFPYNPDSLVSGNDYSVYDEMRDDDQVKVALNLKKAAVVGTGWTVSCEIEEVRDFIRKTLENVGLNQSLENAWDEVLYDILNAYDYGFTLSEPIFRNPAQSASGLWEVKTVKVRPPHSFIFHLEKDGTVREIEQFASGKNGNIHIDPTNILHYVNDPEFGNPYGRSDLKAAHPAWKAKKFIFRMAMRYAERFAGPTALGRYNSTMGAGEIDRLYRTLRSIQDNTTLVIPQEAQVELIESKRDSSGIYESILNMLNMWIARAILVPDLMGVSGSKTGEGSQSLGREHYKIFQMMVEKDRKILERKINLKIVQPLVRTNYGDVECSFNLKPQDTGEGNELLKMWIMAVNGGAYRPNDEEVNHFRKSVGFPEGEVQEAPKPQMPHPFQNPLSRLEEKKPEPKLEPEVEKKPEFKGVLAFRQKTPYEAKFDFALAEKTLDASDNALTPRLMSLVKRMVNDLVDQIRSKKIVEKFKPESVNRLTVHYQREMNNLIRGHFVSLFRAGVQQAKSEIISDEARKFTSDDIFPDDFEDILRADSFKLVGDITGKILKTTQNELVSGLKDGASLSDIIAAIRAKAVDEEERHIITTVRTRTTEVYNASRKTFFDTDPIAQEIIVGYQFSAINDVSTTEVCASLDGMTFSNEDSDFIARITPPLAFNCRSALVPITKFEPEPKWDEPKSYEWLEKRGANLVQKFSYIPDKVVSGKIKMVGDSPVLSAPGPGLRLKVERLNASIIEIDKTCVVGFRATDQGDVRFLKTLNRYEQTNEPDLGHEGWVLPENTGLSLNASSDTLIAYTCIYSILDMSGVEVEEIAKKEIGIDNQSVTPTNAP